MEQEKRVCKKQTRFLDFRVGRIEKMKINTIAAIATPMAAGGVSMIRVSGPEAISVAEKVFLSIQKKPLSLMKGYTAAYGRFYNEAEEQIDDGIALVCRAPKSYTGEDVVELSCHGGILITREILRLLLQNGARLAEPGEFSKRAFLNGKLSLTQAESIMDLINSRNNQALKSAKAQMDGALFRRIQKIKENLLGIAGHLAAWVDYPEEDIDVLEEENLLQSLTEAEKVVDELLATYDTGKIIREGVETAIVGKPNVGKSTLMNLLSGCEKSIVTDIAGTTRDVVEESVNLGNVVLRLADTAGIRETDDVVEKYGVDLALKRIQTAGLVLAVFDYSLKLTEEDYRLIEAIDEHQVPAIAVINKTDLTKNLEEEYLKEHFEHMVYTSIDNTNSLKLLSEEIESLLRLIHIDTASGMIANERQRACAIQAGNALKEAVETLKLGFTLDAVTVSIDAAIEALLELTGERVTEEVVNQVFHRFCVGK